MIPPTKTNRTDDLDRRGRSPSTSPEGKSGRETLLWRILNFERDSHDVVKQHMPRFFENRRQNLNEMRRALSTRKLDELRRLAHLFRASASMMGFGYLATLSGKLEDQAQLPDPSPCKGALGKLEDEFHRLESIHDDRH